MNKDDLKKLWKLSGITPYSGARFSRSSELSDASLPQLVTVILEFIHFNPSQMKGDLYLLAYDISENRTRKLVSDYLLRQGMKRIQKSVFIGIIESARMAAIVGDLYEVNSLYMNEDSIVVIPLSRDRFKQSEMIGRDLRFEGFSTPPNCVVH